MRRKFGLSLVAALLVCDGVLVTSWGAGGYGNTDSARKDGGRAVTVTSRSHSECTVFSTKGEMLCRRTFPITDHKAAIAKCVAMKC